MELSLFFRLLFLLVPAPSALTSVENLSDLCFPIELKRAAQAGRSCGDRTCKCIGQIADCSAAQVPLDAVPNIGRNVKFLSLQGREIRYRSHKNNAFFRSAERITHLSLSLATLEIPGSGDQLDVMIFKQIKNLTCLSLDRVKLEVEVPAHFDFGAPPFMVKSTFFIYVFTKIPTLRSLSVGRHALTWNLLQDRWGLILRPLEYDRLTEQFLNISQTLFHSPVETLVISENSPPNRKVWKDMNFCGLKEVRELDLSNCGILYLDMTSSETCTWPTLKKFWLNGNDYTGFPKTCVEGRSPRSLYPNLRYLNLSSNAMVTLIADDCTQKPNDVCICLPSLETLDLSRNNLLSELFTPALTKEIVPSLLKAIFDNQRRHFERIESRFGHEHANVSSLKQLSFVNNQIDFSSSGQLQNMTFEHFPETRELILDGNNFLNVDDQRFTYLFGKLEELRTLSLGHCEIKEVFYEALAKFERLSKLILSGNRIPSVPDGSFDSLLHLKFLDLSQNSITVVSEDSFGEQTRSKLKSLYLATNPFTCSCDAIWFRNWLLSRPSLFRPNRSSLSYMCYNIPNTRVEHFKIHPQKCLLSREVSTQIITACTLILLTMSTVAFVFRYRWHIRLLLYEAFRGSKGNERRLRLLVNHFEYDVFVSYDSAEEDWVRRRLMPELEDGLGLRLCIHERDFIPGKNIVENIVDCVESSKKILMVFSREFVKSQWCQFELNFCLGHVMEHGDALIIVCVDDVASRDMTSAMMAVLKTTTYIQWCEDEDAQRSFWGRIRLALDEVFDHNEHIV